MFFKAFWLHSLKSLRHTCAPLWRGPIFKNPQVRSVGSSGLLPASWAPAAFRGLFRVSWSPLGLPGVFKAFRNMLRGLLVSSGLPGLVRDLLEFVWSLWVFEVSESLLGAFGGVFGASWSLGTLRGSSGVS